MAIKELSNPVVAQLVSAINRGDRQGFRDLLAPGCTLSDDGIQRDLQDWIDREIFTSNGKIDVERESRDGLALKARFRNDTWGEMRTQWEFRLDGDKIAHIETGQA
ncbi:MAG: nuclear transport factor 2 family protein [Streptosporangiales bacterium]|nr:nuclear transport factor 2 family protein [Streptosporangiales bacterium]